MKWKKANKRKGFEKNLIFFISFKTYVWSVDVNPKKRRIFFCFCQIHNFCSWPEIQRPPKVFMIYLFVHGFEKNKIIHLFFPMMIMMIMFTYSQIFIIYKWNIFRFFFFGLTFWKLQTHFILIDIICSKIMVVVVVLFFFLFFGFIWNENH